MKKIVVICFYCIFCASIAYGQDSPFFDMVKLDNKDDFSATLISGLFDSVWSDLLGGTVEPKGYSGLFLALLGFLNLAGLIYASSMILYIWTIAAVSTAHEGKQIGGVQDIFSSMWIPVRHAATLALMIPVFKGLSIMQILIVISIGLSINTANIVWNYAGGKIVEISDNRIVTSYTRASKIDAYEMAPVIFQSLVVTKSIYEYYKNNKESAWNFDYSNNGNVFELLKNNPKQLAFAETSIDFNGNYDKDGLLVALINYKSGYVQIKPRNPKNINNQSLSGVNIDIQQWDCKDRANRCSKPSGSDYQIKEAVSEMLIKNVLELYSVLNKITDKYLGTDTGGCVALNGKPCESSAKLGKEIVKEINEASNKYAEQCSEGAIEILNRFKLGGINEWRNTLATSMGIKNVNGNSVSEFGWISAGIFPLSVASIEQSIHNQFNIGIYVSLGEKVNSLFEFLNSDSSDYLDRYKISILNSYKFMSSYIAQDEYYVSKKLANNDKSTWMDFLKEGLIKSFNGDNAARNANAGILGYVLRESGKYDPIIVLTQFGNKIMNAAESIFLVGVVTKGAVVAMDIAQIVGVSRIPLANAMLEWIKRPIDAVGTAGIFTGITLMGVGAMFAYIFPMLPVIFWFQAVFSWFFTIVESMVAAPFWVCSHALSAGIGFTGQSAKRGYLMLFDIMIKPTVMVIGVIIAIVLTKMASKLINFMFNVWFSNNLSHIGFTADIIYAIIAVSMIYYIYYIIFTTGVLYIPRRISKWAGQVSVAGIGGEENITQEMMVAGNAKNEMKQLSNRATTGLGNTTSKWARVAQISGRSG